MAQYVDVLPPTGYQLYNAHQPLQNTTPSSFYILGRMIFVVLIFPGRDFVTRHRKLLNSLTGNVRSILKLTKTTKHNKKNPSFQTHRHQDGIMDSGCVNNDYVAQNERHVGV